MKTLLFSSPLLDPSGYAEAGRLYLKSLLLNGAPVKVHHPTYDLDLPITHQDLPTNFTDLKFEDGDVEYDIFLNHVTPDISFVDPEKPSYIYSVWETDCIPHHFVAKCDRFNSVFTSSEFSKSAFIKGGVNVPVTVIPHPIIKKKFKYNDKLVKSVNNKFVFFFNSEWHTGKGFDILIPSFVKAFSGNKDVVLIIKTCSMDRSRSYDKKSEIKGFKNGSTYPSIILIDDIISEDNLFTLYDRCDVYASASRREAFGLGMAEALSFGKTIIAPDKGGHVEFLNDYSHYIPVRSGMIKVPRIELSRSLYAGQNWVEPDPISMVEAFRSSMVDCIVSKNNHRSIMDKFSLETIGKKLIKELGL